MALTTQDISHIKRSMVDVIEPRFADTNARIEDTNVRIETKFTALKTDIDQLTAATNRKFHTAFTDITVLREDIHVVKQLVTEHGFRIARLEHRPDIEG